ncbi:MAG TPA: ChbG/HpnK family deacetylase [Candidatus Sulfotelmatobacter sp.]
MNLALGEETAQHSTETQTGGCLIINADDWGRDRATTDRIRECFDTRAISSASAMVFMEDSPRAAEVAHQRGLDCGLHLNLTQAFSAPSVAAQLAGQHSRVVRYLRRSRFAQVCFHPGLANAFEYAVKAQVEEFWRLYGRLPERIDGHHHMHLAANVLLQGLIPEGSIVRRNFSFTAGEKSWGNRMYRGFQDRRLARKYRMTDYFFSLPPLDPASRLEEIFRLAQTAFVEVETHPVNAEEHQFLADGEIWRRNRGLPISNRYRVANLNLNSI